MKVSKYCPSIYKACMDKSGEEYEFQEQNPKLKDLWQDSVVNLK